MTSVVAVTLEDIIHSVLTDMVNAKFLEFSQNSSEETPAIFGRQF